MASLSCSKCKSEPRIPGQRWGRYCLTSYQQGRRARIREERILDEHGFSTGAAATSGVIQSRPGQSVKSHVAHDIKLGAGPTSIHGVIHTAYQFNTLDDSICGRGRQKDWPEGCGKAFSAVRTGQIYCCKHHGSGKQEHSLNCSIPGNE